MNGDQVENDPTRKKETREVEKKKKKEKRKKEEKRKRKKTAIMSTGKWHGKQKRRLNVAKQKLSIFSLSNRSCDAVWPLLTGTERRRNRKREVNRPIPEAKGSHMTSSVRAGRKVVYLMALNTGKFKNKKHIIIFRTIKCNSLET